MILPLPPRDNLPAQRYPPSPALNGILDKIHPFPFDIAASKLVLLSQPGSELTWIACSHTELKCSARTRCRDGYGKSLPFRHLSRVADAGPVATGSANRSRTAPCSVRR